MLLKILNLTGASKYGDKYTNILQMLAYFLFDFVLKM